MSARPADPMLTHARPLLSICIPTYKRADQLAQTLTHLREVCWGDDVEIVISDNCSPDHTQEVIAQFAARFRYFRAIRQAENRGGMPNLAAAIALASGEFIYTLSDDDEIFISGLGAAISIMKGNEQILAVYGGYQEWSRETGSLSAPISAVEQRVDFARGEKLQIFNRCSLLWFPVCRTQFLQRFFTYDERSFGFWELVGSLLEHGAISVIPDLFYKHFQTEPRMEYELTKAWYHDQHRAQYEAYMGRIGPSDYQRLSAFIDSRVVPAYTQGVRFADLKKEFLTARHFVLRARAFGQFPEADIAEWEKRALTGMVAERLLAHIRLATGARQVLFEDHPKLTALREHFASIAADFLVGSLSQRDWETSGLEPGSYLVTHEFGAPGWEKTLELGPSRCRAVSDVIETCRITNQPLSL